MLGALLFDNLNDVVYMQSDDGFANHIRSMALNAGILIDREDSQSSSMSHELDRNVILQLFSPLVTSHRVMNDQFKNGYNFVSCEDGTTLVFHEIGSFLLVAVGKAAEETLQRYAQVTERLIISTVGPSISILKSNVSKSRQLDSLLSAWLLLQKKEQGYLVEAIERILVEPDVTSTCFQALQAAIKELKHCKKFIPGHALLLSQNKILALYSESTEELTSSEVLIINLVVESYFHKSNCKTALSCMSSCYEKNEEASSGKEYNTYELFFTHSNGFTKPYTMYFHQVNSELNLVLLVEPFWADYSCLLTSILITLDKSVPLKKISIELMENKLKSAEEYFSKLPSNIQEQAHVHLLQTTRRWETMKHNGNTIEGELTSKSESFFEALSESVRSLWQTSFLNYHQDEWNIHITAAIRSFHESISGSPTLLQPKALLNLSSEKGPQFNINKYMEEFPGLVHFIYIDRSTNQLTAPVLNAGLAKDNSRSNTITVASLWTMVQFARDHLAAGHQCLLWKDRTFAYSYFLWFEDYSGNPIKPEQNFDQIVSDDLPLPGILTKDFYRHLASRLFPSMDSRRVKIYELFCIHIGLVTSPCVIEQTRRLAATVWEISGSSLPNPIDLL